MGNFQGTKNVLVAYGTRPEAIKMAPFVSALERSASLRATVAVSGQHREMLDQVNALFGIIPDYDLNLISPGQSLTQITTRALDGYSALIAEVRPDAVAVQGDTTTTFAASLAAFYAQLPVIHLEAGLRTNNPYSPFPEEINRRLTTQLASLHLAATPLNRLNLEAEGVAPDRIRTTGNTVIDALLDVSSRPGSIGHPALEADIADGRQVVLVTAHRRESWGEPMRQIGLALADLAKTHPDVAFALPVHRNPVVRSQLLPPVEGLTNVRVTEPLDYQPLALLLSACHMVLTDSGGLQEEAPSLGKPVLVMRDSTERPEAIAAGTAKLVGTDRLEIFDSVSELLLNPDAHEEMAKAVNPYGDGKAAQRSVAALEALMGVGEALPDFDASAISLNV